MEVSVMRGYVLSISLVVSAASLLAACAMPGDDPNFGMSASGTSLESGGILVAGTDAPSLVAEYSTAPTDIQVTEPLSSTPKPGSLIVSLNDGSDTAKVLEEGLKAAAESLGWTVNELPVADDAESQFDAALALKPAGIQIFGSQFASLQEALATAETQGIPVVCVRCAGEPAGAIKDTSIAGQAQMEAWADMIAAFVADTADDAGVDLVTNPNDPGLSAFSQAFTTQLSTYCPLCLTTEIPLDEATTADERGAAVVDAVSLDILATFVVADDGDEFTGVPSALRTAGLTDQVQLAGNMGTKENIAGLKDTTQAAWTGYSATIAGWRVADSFARIFGGDPVQAALLPTQLMTQANANDLVLDATGNYLGVADYAAQFKQLWKLP